MGHDGLSKGLMGDLSLLAVVSEMLKSRFLGDNSTITWSSAKKAPENKKSYWVNPGFSGIPP